MPKKRPFFEFKGLSGLVDSINRITGGNHRSRLYDYDSYGGPRTEQTSGSPRDYHRGNHRSRRRSRHRSGYRSRSSRYYSRSRPSRYRDRPRRFDYYEDRDYTRERYGKRRIRNAGPDDRDYDSPSPEIVSEVPPAQLRANANAAALAAAAGAAAAVDVGHTTGNIIAPNGQSQMGSIAAPSRSHGRSGPRSERSLVTSGASGGGRTYASSQRLQGQSRFARSHASRSITSRIKDSVKKIVPSRFRGSQAGDDGYMLDGMSEGVPRPSQLQSERSSRKKVRNRKRWMKTAAVVAAAGLALKWLLSRNKDDKDGENSSRGSKKGGGDDDDDDDADINGRSVRRVNPFKLQPPNAFGMVRVPQGEAYIIERSGKYHRKVTAGSNVLIPFMDRVAFRHTLREIGVPLPAQACISQDSVDVLIDALMFVRIEDPVAASYGVDNLYRSLMMMSITCMSEEISRLTIDDLFKHRQALNKRITSLINGAARPWGIRCTRFDLKNIVIPEELRSSMYRATEAEHLRRADILFSEGQRAALINRADGEMQAQMRLSQARQMDIVNQAIGEAHAIQERGEAIANAMREVADVVNEPGGKEALQLRIAEQYGNAYAAADRSVSGDGAQYAYDPAHMSDAMNNAIGLLSSLGDPNVNVANPHIVPQSRGPVPTNDIGHGIPEHGEYNGYYEDEDADEEHPQHPNQHPNQRYDNVDMYDGYDGYSGHDRYNRYNEHDEYDGYIVDDRQNPKNGVMRTSQGATYYDDRDISPEESDTAYESRMRSPRRSSATPGPDYRFNSSARTASL